MACGSKTLNKSVAAVALAILFAFSCIVMLGKTVRADENGASGEGWTLSADGDLVISSSDAFGDNEWENAGITIRSIYITAPSIPDYAFNQYTTGKYTDVTTVTVNETVTSVGVACFKDFSGLTSVKYYPKYSKVPYMSFYNCENLDTIAFSDSVTEIGNSAFCNCTDLTTITMKKIQTIGDSAFSHCEKLKSVDLLSVTSIGNGAFCDCYKLESVQTTFNGVTGEPLDKVTSIGALAFKNCSALDDELNLNKVTAIPNETFYGCSKLAKVSLFNAETVGKQAFYGCTSLTAAYFDDDAKTIGEESFRSCSNLASVGTLRTVITIDKYAFAGCSTLSGVTLDAIEVLGEHAFSNCSGFISVELGDNLRYIQDYAFSGCSKLISINLSEIYHVGYHAFDGCTALLAADLRNVEMIDDHAFSGCTELTDLVLSYYLFSYAKYSFEFDNIETLVFIGSQSILDICHFDTVFPNATITLRSVDVYVVTMDYGNDTASYQYLKKDKKAENYDDIRRPGYRFTGWYTDKACSKLYDFDTPVTSDLHLYAGWAKEAIGVGDVIKGYSLSLEGDIGVKFYTVLPEGISEDAYMMFTVDGISQPQKMYVKDAVSTTVKDVEYKVFKCCVPAKNMTSEISVSLVDGNEPLFNYSYSVMRYANYILDNENEFEKAAPVVKALLNYGAYAQAYFDCNTNYPANNIVNEGERDVSSVTADTLSAFASASDIYVNEGITFSSVNLELESELTMNLYFTGDLDGVEFRLDKDNDLKVRELSDGRIVVSITGISAEDIDENFNVSLYSGETELGAVTYSPMNYCYNVLARPESATRTPALKDAIRALYLYNQAANAYIV